MLANKASKHTLGQHVDALTLSRSSLGSKSKTYWLPEGRLTSYQALLMDTPDITLKVCQALKAATLLPAVKSGDFVSV